MELHHSLFLLYLFQFISFCFGNDFTTLPYQTAINRTLYWGTYRPQLYLGVSNREESGRFLGGIAWQPNNPLVMKSQDVSYNHWLGSAATHSIRHICEQGDNLKGYGWLQHDGTSFGQQEIQDSPGKIKLTTEFIKKDYLNERNGHWAIRLTGKQLDSKQKNEGSATLFFFFSTEEQGGQLDIATKFGRKGIGSKNIHLKGKTQEIGEFSIFLHQADTNLHPEYPHDLVKHKVKSLSDLSKTHFYGTKLAPENVWRSDIVDEELRKTHAKVIQEMSKIKEKLESKRKGSDMPDMPLLVPTLPNTIDSDSNVVILQTVVKLPFEMEVIFISHDSHKEDQVKEILSSLSGEQLSKAVIQASQSFEQRFEEVFQLTQKGYSKSQISVATAAFSNLIGGIGYFSGNSFVKRTASDSIHLVDSSKLFTAVPSRPFFPRGFLWDEGFHELLISEWNVDITFDVLRHWYNLMDDDGWIAREQILGEEARRKVPREFQVQYDNFANPPTLLLVLDKIHRKYQFLSQQPEGLKYREFLQYIFPLASRHYQWLKRTQKGVIENTFRWRGRTVNHTLTSGLDDYPRSIEPSTRELHLDLLCWMAKSAEILNNIGNTLSINTEDYAKDHSSFLQSIEDVHWNNNAKLYLDISLYESDGTITWANHKGYISLYPLMLGLIPANSENLQSTLQMLREQDGVWSPYGIRSLAASDPLFGTKENYWRGPIWINMNYLILSALHEKYIHEGPYKDLAKGIYEELRNNVVQNIINNYQQTGYIWEQYHPTTGQGQRSHPFTGWSSLLVNIMAEKF